MDNPGAGQGGEGAPGSRHDRQQAGTEPGPEHQRRMPKGQAEPAWGGRQRGRRTVATACAAMPSARPVKPSFSVVVALTLTRSGVMPRMAAMRATIAAR